MRRRTLLWPTALLTLAVAGVCIVFWRKGWSGSAIARDVEGRQVLRVTLGFSDIGQAKDNHVGVTLANLSPSSLTLTRRTEGFQIHSCELDADKLPVFSKDDLLVLGQGASLKFERPASPRNGANCGDFGDYEVTIRYLAGDHRDVKEFRTKGTSATATVSLR